MRYFNDTTITKELPMIKERKGYKPLNNDEPITVHFNLTDEQINFVDMMAKKHDIEFQTALDIVWKDAFKMLNDFVHVSIKYPFKNSSTVTSKVNHGY